jgi:hypothetical protein
MRKLRKLRERLGNTVIDGRKLEKTPCDGKKSVPAERLKPLFLHQLDVLAYSNVNEEDRFRTLVAAADIIHMRERTHKRLIKELKTLAATICLLFVISVVFAASEQQFSSVMSAIIASPFSPLGGAEALTFVFLIYRLVQEYRDLRDLNDSPID